MKGIYISSDCELKVKDFTSPLRESLDKAIGGKLEAVKPAGLPGDYVMVYDKSGGFTARNALASAWLGRPVTGDIVILRGTQNNKLSGLLDSDIPVLMGHIRVSADMLLAEVEA